MLLTPSPSAPAPSPSARIGDYVQVGNWRYSVRQVDTSKTISRGVFGTKTAKGLFVLVWIELTNVAKENYIINLSDFELWDARAVHYTADYDSSYVATARGQAQVGVGEKFPPGVSIATTVVFDVAPVTTGMQLYLVQANQLIRLE